MQALTLLDYFESRFQDHKHLIRITGVVIIGLFITAYVSAQLSAGARALSTALNLPILLALGCSALLIIIYMMMGGYIAVAYNDVIRAVIMIFGLVIFPIIGLVKIGGLDELLHILAELRAQPPRDRHAREHRVLLPFLAHDLVEQVARCQRC